jgi:hypothetical protein
MRDEEGKVRTVDNMFYNKSSRPYVTARGPHASPCPRPAHGTTRADRCRSAGVRDKDQRRHACCSRPSSSLSLRSIMFSFGRGGARAHAHGQEWPRPGKKGFYSPFLLVGGPCRSIAPGRYRIMLARVRDTPAHQIAGSSHQPVLQLALVYYCILSQVRCGSNCRKE